MRRRVGVHGFGAISIFEYVYEAPGSPYQAVNRGASCCLPNRDSVSYKDVYGLKDATKVLRGTLRYNGFCELINAFKEIGYFD